MSANAVGPVPPQPHEFADSPTRSPIANLFVSFWPALLWPKLSHLSLCLPTGLQNRCVTWRFHPRKHAPLPSKYIRNDLLGITEVPNPGQYGLPYHDLELQTEDGVKLKCYLLAQTKELASGTATQDAILDEEVCRFLSLALCVQDAGGALLLRQLQSR